MNKVTILSILLTCSAASSSAQMKLHGKIINHVGIRTPQLSVEYWDADRWQQSEGCPINDDNTFNCTLRNPVPGQYRFRMFGQSKTWSDFIVADSSMADPSLEFVLDNSQMTGGPSPVIGSKANELYYSLLTAYATHDSTHFDWPDFNARCMDIVKLYRKSLIGDIALMMYEPQKSDYKDKAVAKMTANEFAKAHALDKIPFEHENILHHNMINKQLARYSNYFPAGEAGGNALIDGIMARRNGNEAVDGFLFRYLLEKMMDSKNDASLSYLLKWYAPDCPEDDPQPDYIKNLLEALKACAPGNQVPDLNYPNPEGQVVNLNQICAKNKLTLLLFWKSSCSHCKEFEPVLLELYKKYHPLGVEVYAMSSDRDESPWLAFLQSNPSPWINVFIPKDKRIDIGRQFPAPSTPTVIVLDNKRRVVSRVVSRTNLDANLDAELAKRK